MKYARRGIAALASIALSAQLATAPASSQPMGSKAAPTIAPRTIVNTPPAIGRIPLASINTPDSASKKVERQTRNSDERLSARILEEAYQHEGYIEEPNHMNKFSNNKYPWCSVYLTLMWQQAGVDIPTLPLTGDLYRWGIAHGQAYSDKSLATDMRVGDALLFGTGPETRFTSTHVGIVSRIDENSVTLIEGNAILPGQTRKDPHRVTEKTYPQEAWKREFYGGVHPSKPSR